MPINFSSSLSKLLYFLIALIFVVVLLTTIVNASLPLSDSVTDSPDTDIPVIPSERFMVYDKSSFEGDNNCYVVVDTFTGIQYLYVDGFSNGGLTVLYDVNGLPLLYDNNAE